MTAPTATHEDQRIKVAGRELRILRGGSGPPVVVLHHSTGNPGWLPFHESLAANHTVLAPDMPGYGQSERPQWARDPRDLAILLGEALDQLGLDQVSLVGLGFGGYVAAEMATMNQGRLKALVLIGSAGLQPERGEILDQMLIDFDEYVKAGFRDDAAFEHVFGTEVEQPVKELWDLSREMTARLSWKPYMFSRQLPHTLQEVKTPTLIVWGSEDRVVPPECAGQFQRALSNARLELLQGAGHLVEYEDPGRVAELISAHITSA